MLSCDEGSQPSVLNGMSCGPNELPVCVECVKGCHDWRANGLDFCTCRQLREPARYPMRANEQTEHFRQTRRHRGPSAPPGQRQSLGGATPPAGLG